MSESEPWVGVADLARRLIHAGRCWAPTLSADGRQMAYIGDGRGVPELWVQSVEAAVLPGHPAARRDPRPIELSADPVVAAHWSPDSQWLAAAVATGGGVRTEVWVVRPDGTRARRISDQRGDTAAGHEVGEHGRRSPDPALLGPWLPHGHRCVITLPSEREGEQNRARLVDPATGRAEELAVGGLLEVLDLSDDLRFVLLRDGTRGARFCRLLDRQTDRDFPLLPYARTGSTESGVLRPTPPGTPPGVVAYLVTDAGSARRSLVAVGIGHDGQRLGGGVIAARDDADLELADADRHGRHALLVWNVDGCSKVELLDLASGDRRACDGLPGLVVGSAALAREGTSAVIAVEGPASPPRLWHLEAATGAWTSLTPETVIDEALVWPTLERFESHDGLEITGWLYRPAGETGGPRPTLISLHGGPEAQERPSFNPQHQTLAAAGIAVFAPNIRGSSGYGRSFVHADDRHGRLDAVADVADCAEMLVARGIARADQLVVSGRSYGGYATLMALVTYPDRFAAGIDICGMSDLLTFYRDTEPWIARAAVSKYGDPHTDAELLARLSPLAQIDRVVAPLLVVHGELDTNVPTNESRQVVAALRSLGRPVEYLELPGEGHEYRRRDSQLVLMEAITRFVGRALSPAGIGAGQAR